MGKNKKLSQEQQEEEVVEEVVIVKKVKKEKKDKKDKKKKVKIIEVVEEVEVDENDKILSKKEKKSKKSKKQSNQQDIEIEEEEQEQEQKEQKSEKSQKSSKKEQLDDEQPLIKKKVKLGDGNKNDNNQQEGKNEIIIQGLSYESSEDDLKNKFIELNDGDDNCLVSVKLLWDNNNNRSRGTAFAVFKEKIQMFNVIAKLNNQEFMGRKIRVADTAERQKKNTDPLQLLTEEQIKESKTVRLRNLSFKVKEEQIQEIFEKCGKIEKVRIEKNDKGKSRGYGFIDFSEKEGFLKAIEKNGIKILDRETVVEVWLREKTEEEKKQKLDKDWQYISKKFGGGQFPNGVPQEQNGENGEQNEGENQGENQEENQENKDKKLFNNNNNKNQNSNQRKKYGEVEGAKQCLFVGNLDFEITEQEVKNFFDEKLGAGKVSEVRLAKYQDGGLKGFGFVEFYNQSDVQYGMKLDKASFRNRNLIIQTSQSKKKD
ncbi:hypothetical protein PPERSA_09731 [Pseudocohnilembus persalinus]|uniref:RRM domain-containing protein n=1 Tax=Pseudocohnilembus persalinus TaxID=266149 RepID=A0A0V0QV42_PSEPJ|nr:hypothetical protein PPERSA_09731 [Pseudocohnilembus persalinus]|eukprot:KRX06119.1 hypothetical protein PPERSA_09731 [Pseudocohnilembus persalinus]